MGGKRIDSDIYGRIKKLTGSAKYTGFTQKTIADMTGISASTVNRIAKTEDYEDYILVTKQNTEKNSAAKKSQLQISTEEPIADEIPFKSKPVEEGYRFTVDVVDDVAMCKMFWGDELLYQGHGHVFYDGDEGVAQAVSYGFKKIYYRISGKDKYNG